jgi:drug/metabolite transporter (DMT)-like permease
MDRHPGDVPPAAAVSRRLLETGRGSRSESFGALALFPAARRPLGREDRTRVAFLGVIWAGLPLILFPVPGRGPALAMLLLGILGTGLAFVPMTTLVGRIGGPRGAVATYFIPVVAIVLGVLLEEPWAPRP